MSVVPSQAVNIGFTLRNPKTGVVSNVDPGGGPTGVLKVAGVVDAAVVTITNPATGSYNAALTLPGGLTIGQGVELWLTATVGGVTDTWLEWRERYDLALDAVGAVPVAFGTALPTTPTSGTVGEALWFPSKQIGRRGTAQAGAAATITLDAGASAIDNAFRGHQITLTGGTGSGQVATIVSYVGATKIAAIVRNGGGGGWSTIPDPTSVFLIEPMPLANVGLWLGSTPDALSSGKLPADVKLWLAAAPAALSTNGYVQAMLLRWLTDNAGGTPNALQTGRVDGYLGAVAASVIAAGSFAANALDAVWSTASRLLTAGTNIVLAKGAGVTGFNDLDAAGVRGAVGLAAANLDTQIAAVQADTDNLQTRLPATLVGGRIDASVGAMAAGTVTAAAVATDAIDADALAADAVTEIQSGLATSANQTTILNRLGAWTGSGLNTILGAFRALSAKAAALTPTDLSTGTTYDNTTDSLDAQAETLAALPGEVVAAAGLGAPGPDRCELFSYELGGVAETPINGRVVSLELLAQPSGEATSILETQRETVTTGPDGYWRFYPPRGGSVRLRIPQAGVDATFTVPDAASANARALL